MTHGSDRGNGETNGSSSGNDGIHGSASEWKWWTNDASNAV